MSAAKNNIHKIIKKMENNDYDNMVSNKKILLLIK